jgi:hypothetical protein
LQKVVDRVGNSANAVAKEFGPGRLVGSPVSYDTGLVLRV